MLRGFLRGCRAGEMASEIHEIFYAFGPQLNTFMSVRIWLKYFRRKLLQFEWSNAVSNLGMSSFISLTKLCSATSFYTLKNFTFLHSNFHKCRRLTAFPWHSKKLYILGYIPCQDFKVFLLLPHAFEDLAKVKKYYCKFEFRLNCKQRFTFHQGPIHV